MQQQPFTITARLVDVWKKEIYPANVTIANGIITAIEQVKDEPGIDKYIMPGFIDSHVHIESSMLVPAEFAKLAVVHGTVATVSDPHEIANVCGMQGVEFMINNGKRVNFKFNFGAPSCVPATVFETAGATLNSEEVTQLLQKEDILYLSEMMNFPGVLNGDEEVLKKIAAAHALGKPVDGHAPGLKGDLARVYINAGISTDHECFTADEALDKLKYGMKILIREGSAAKNFEALADLLHEHAGQMMFCSDDKHPDSLVEGHINQLCARAVAKGINLFNVLQAACVNPVLHYRLKVGLLKLGDAADFIVVNDLANFIVSETYINGELVAKEGTSLLKTLPAEIINHFDCEEIVAEDLKINQADFVFEDGKIAVIEALEGQLITNKLWMQPKLNEAELVSDIVTDVLKIVVINRYHKAPVAKAFIKNFGLKQGAIASSVAHDSHNIIAVGVDDDSICAAVNLVIKEKGGISCVNSLATEDVRQQMVLALPVAGLMSAGDGYKVAEEYTAIDRMAKELGSTLAAPFMTLSFMALLVIPHLKLSDLGLFDGDAFQFITRA